MESTKTEIRKAALQRRDGLPEEVRAAFAARLASLGPRLVRDFASSTHQPLTALFHTIGSEPNAMPLAIALNAALVPLALPVDWSPGTPLVYRRWFPGDRLSAGPLEIAEPLPDSPQVAPDVLFIPFAAFDRLGNRIGYGAGNVDRTLAQLRDRKRILAIGVGYSVQEELIVPREPHDEQLDVIITERDLLICNPG